MIRVLLLVALIAVAACSSTTAPDPEGLDADLLEGGEWTLLVSPQMSSAWESSPAHFTIVFTSDGRLAGRAGPNSYAGIYSAEDGGYIQVDSVGSTRIGGIDAERAAEYLAILISATAFSVNEKYLHIVSGDEHSLRLIRRPQPASY